MKPRLTITLRTLSLACLATLLSFASLQAQTQQVDPLPTPTAPENWNNRSSTTNIFFRGDMGLPRGLTADVMNKPIGGFSFGMARSIPKTRLLVGGSLGFWGIQQKHWDAPYSNSEISVSEACYNRSTAMIEALGFARYELFKDFQRVVPYAEGGMGVGLLGSDYEVSVQNPRDNCDYWVLERASLSRQLVPNAYAGGGTLVRLTGLGKSNIEYNRLYLDLFAGARTSLVEARYNYGDNWEQRNSPLQFLYLRAGIIFRMDCPLCVW